MAKAVASPSVLTVAGEHRICIESVGPTIEGGEFTARAVAGQFVHFSATIFREGHDKVGANVLLTPPVKKGARAKPKPIRVRMSAGAEGTDEWIIRVQLPEPGAWSFAIEAWSDPIATWQNAVTKKFQAGQDAAEMANDLSHGSHLLAKAAIGSPAAQAKALRAAAKALGSLTLDLDARIEPAMTPSMQQTLHDHPVRELITVSAIYKLWVDRQRAAVGNWYEFFPRSTGGWDLEGNPVHGNFATSIGALPRIAAMGFDVVYLPPIHPIGVVNRKGRNNTLTPNPADVGSPWAIGSVDGGHDAVHPELGTMDDFDAFVAAAAELDLEVALDLALQCAPDHPWVLEHPDWFTTLDDGTIAFAENPPKKYQDIYPLNFDLDPAGLYSEVRRVVKLWISHGVKIFRVDNPHTKPLNFWHWLIWDIKKTDPDVIFLAEAFTRPAVMNGLGKRGFSQSYTYFTWRTEKAELEDFARDLGAYAYFFNGNLFVNTPDILHESLQYGGPPMFKIRAVLAATMASSWGVYSGFEIFEHVAVKPGSEEYLDSEKYELRPRDFAAARAAGRSLEDYVGTLNRIRADHPALRSSATDLFVHQTDNPQVIAYSRRDMHSGDAVIVVCSLDSYNQQISSIELDLAALGLEPGTTFIAHDEVSGADWIWSEHNYVELSPYGEPAHIIAVRPTGSH